MNQAGNIIVLRGIVGAILVLLAADSMAATTAAPGTTSTTSAQQPGTKPAQPATAQPATQKKKKQQAPIPVSQIIDVNSASKQQLKTLPGIGEAEADKIIANRPYPSKVETVTKGAIPHGIYIQIKDRIIAKQPNTPEPSKSSSKKSTSKTSTDKTSTAK
jgi:competence protein ComEA